MKVSLVKRVTIISIMILLVFGSVNFVIGATGSSLPEAVINNQTGLPDDHNPEVMVKGKVVKLISEEEIIDSLSQQPTTNQILKVRITSGKYKGKEIAVINYQNDTPVFNMQIEEGNDDYWRC